MINKSAKSHFSSVILAATAGLVLSSAPVVASTATSKASMPNILFIMADDLGWMDTGVYGSRFYETPHIDQLAAEGMRFTEAYSANPLCAPTRASIVTGLNPARIGITAPQTHPPEVNFVQNLRNPPPEYGYQVNSSVTRLRHFYYTLGEAFADLGYATGHFGKWHIGMTPYSPLEQGYAVDIPHWHGSGPAGRYLAPWGWLVAPELTWVRHQNDDRLLDTMVAVNHEQPVAEFVIVLEPGEYSIEVGMNDPAYTFNAQLFVLEEPEMWIRAGTRRANDPIIRQRRVDLPDGVLRIRVPGNTPFTMFNYLKIER